MGERVLKGSLLGAIVGGLIFALASFLQGQRLSSMLLQAGMGSVVDTVIPIRLATHTGLFGALIGIVLGLAATLAGGKIPAGSILLKLAYWTSLGGIVGFTVHVIPRLAFRQSLYFSAGVTLLMFGLLTLQVDTLTLANLKALALVGLATVVSLTLIGTIGSLWQGFLSDRTFGRVLDRALEKAAANQRDPLQVRQAVPAGRSPLKKSDYNGK